MANIFRGLGELTSSPSPRDKNITLATHYLGAWAGLLLPELCHNISLERPSMPLIFMFRNRPEREQQKQLKEARRRLSFVPAAGRPGSRDLTLLAAPPVATLRKDWLCCVRPSVLLFRKGGLLFMEPYFPHRFARNLGYDQDVPPNADFVLSTRAYKGPDRHLVASSWWCYFLRRDTAPEFFVPELRHEGRVGILYARWWSRHSQAFQERADDIKKAERDYLSRAGALVSTIAPTFLQREFADIAHTVTTVGRRRAVAQATSMADSEAFAGALKPLSRPESSSATSRVRGEPPLVYFWWRHFLLDCDYPIDAALTSPILPSVTRVWERHLEQSIIRVGPREFISWIKSGTTLRHFWDAIAEAGKAVKVPFDRVVLRPTFSVAPRECFIPEKDLPRRDTPSARKRRASEEAGPSQPAARGRTPEPSSLAVAGASTSGVGELAEGTPREDVAPQDDVDYNPTFDGTPSPEGANIPRVASAETEYIPVEAATAEGVEHLAGVAPVGDAASSLQAIHDLLLSGSEAELPGFSDFAPGILEGGGWMQPLHSVTNDFRPFCISVAVTSAAVLPTASPPEEGEVARGIAGDADDGYFFHNSEPSLCISLARRMKRRERTNGAEIAAEMMESSALGAVLSPAAGTLHPPEGGDSTSLPSDTQAVGGGLLPPSSSEAPLEWPPSFPGHGISWPDAIQRSRVHGSEGMLDFYISSARVVMEESSPPSIDVVRDFLERSTVSYHLMGCPRDPWMAAVDILWSEVAQRHEEAVRHRAQELAAEVALAEQRHEALRSRRGGVVGRAESLSARHASCHADIATLRRTLEEVSSRLAEHEAASLVLAEEVAVANAEVAAVEWEYADSLATLSALQASLADSRRGGAV
ncbi:hypothetical protein Taro_038138 [Colocasia esculenta]|uniref:Aminotransferase-like plant mobile domain-containing protein n=1 Tax=Colocasia esculenta TaxID=4460 RepID=A0A843WMU1_COLES|nr:hypothetical protein [Colocasia esculenta]